MAGLSSIAKHPQRALIDAALIAGDSPHAIAERHAAGLNISRSALYRYARSRQSPLQRRWLASETTVAGAASDLGAVRTELMARFRVASDRGTDAVVARLAREIALVTSTLKRDFDAEQDEEVASLKHSDHFSATVGLTCVWHPEVLAALRSTAAGEGYTDVTDDLDTLAAAIDAGNFDDLQKEN